MRTVIVGLVCLVVGGAIGFLVTMQGATVERARVENVAVAMLGLFAPTAPTGTGSAGGTTAALIDRADLEAWVYPGAGTVTSTMARGMSAPMMSGKIQSEVGRIAILETEDTFEAVLGYYEARSHGGEGRAAVGRSSWTSGSATRTEQKDDAWRCRIDIAAPRPEGSENPHTRLNVVALRGNGFAITAMIQRGREEKKTTILLISDGVSIERASRD